VQVGLGANNGWVGVQQPRLHEPQAAGHSFVSVQGNVAGGLEELPDEILCWNLETVVEDLVALGARWNFDRPERLVPTRCDSQFTFAQALTEAAAGVDNVVVLVSIPASDIEVGGDRGKDALERLKNVVTRKAAQWQPASPDESFEIVRRRLFDPITPEAARTRDGVVRAFIEYYRDKAAEFPLGASEAEYRRRMELSYPIHPEMFDRLFEGWSTLEKFQRTRGVLRLMAVVISELWKRDDRSLLIMSGTLPIDSAPVLSELTKYLKEGWDPVIKTDVDGPNALPLRIDQENKHFGRYSATRRAARTVYMGSAPRPDTNRGVDIKSVVLGCAQPGEPPAQFADALKRLSSDATHLYVDGNQYWFDLQPNVTRLAANRAASNYNADDADDEVRRRMLADRNRQPFAGVHVFPDGPGDVPDDDDGVHLVVLPPTACMFPTPTTATPSPPPRGSSLNAPAAPAYTATSSCTWPRPVLAWTSFARRPAHTWRGSRSWPTPKP